MKATIERATLLKSLGHVQSVVERRNTIPILSNVLIEARDDNSIRLMATDLDLQVDESVPANVDQPGAILADDIGKAIDAGKGKALLATMAGGTLTATKEGDAIVISDGAGTKAKILGGDEKRSNGVIHRIDAVMMPS